MVSFCLPLRALAVLSRSSRRWVRAAFTTVWLAAACGLLVAGAINLRSHDSLDSLQNAVSENQPPRIMLYSGYYGNGMWLLWGYVYDEHPQGIDVYFTGSPLEQPEVATVNSQGMFYCGVYTIGSGFIYANCTDAEGLAAKEAYVHVGY